MEKIKASEETKNLKPLNVYGKHKLISENLVKKYFKNYMIIRTDIFGLNHNNFNKGFANWILNNFKRKS